MKAYIFLLQGQDESLYRKIKLPLEDEFCRAIDIERIDIDSKYGKGSTEEMHKSCRKFLNFLRASFIASRPSGNAKEESSGQFEIIVKNDYESDWYYLGYSYSVPLCGYCFELKQMQMTALFPAVAIMNRIVMLPEEFYQNMDVHPRGFLSLPRSLSFGGVELVDYHTETAIKHAIRKVGAQVKQEWKSLCYRHMEVHSLCKPNYDELGRLLDVEPLLLSSYPVLDDVSLKVSVLEGKVIESTASSVVLEVRNEGGRALRNIRIRVQAPSETLAYPISQLHDLLPPETVKIEVKLTPKAAPICPLEIFIDSSDDPSVIAPGPIPVHVDVLPPDSAQATIP